MTNDSCDIAMLPDPTVSLNEGWQYIPGEAPGLPELEFSGPGGGWPPRPRGQQNVKMLEAEPIPGDLNDDFERALRSRALEDPGARKMLGDRFVHLTTDVRRFQKWQRLDPQLPLETRLLFFSHTHNVTVQVLMSGLTMGEVGRIPGLQPPEVPEEVEQAVALARAHPCLRDAVANMSAGGLLLPFHREDVGSGNRIIWLTFTEAKDTEGELPALYSAAVDMITQQVLVARAEPPISYPNNQDGGACHA